MAKYLVTVEFRETIVYEVEADNKEQARSEWSEGEEVSREGGTFSDVVDIELAPLPGKEREQGA